jgi:serine/threonine protein phosphatase 1
VRTIAIGDIHGCVDALNGLLNAINPSRDDTLIFLGDYVDRGPASKQVIDRLLELQLRCNTVFLRGNHDAVMQQWCDGTLEGDLWMMIGGLATLESYGHIDPSQLPQAHVRFLSELHNFYETETHLFVHAGYHPAMKLEDTGVETLLWEHLSWPLLRPHCSGKTVIVGHTPQTLGIVADFGHLVCIDTFCFGGGNLSAYDVETKSVLQVNSHGQLVRDWGGVPLRKSWLIRFVHWMIPPAKTSIQPLAANTVQA